MITRQLGSLLRGNATPFQVTAACVLGALLGFAPPPAQAPALYPILLAALLVANANIGLSLIVAGGARLLSLAIAPFSFRVGESLLDGPGSEVARTVVNAPVLAWCGLQYYGVAGGLVLALAIGAVTGVALALCLRAFRLRMMAVSANPTRVSELTAKPFARAAIWIFFGKQAKGSWEERLAPGVGNPIRIWGAALLVLAVVGFAFAREPVSNALARRGLLAGLERANGATVDLGPVELDLNAGRLGVSLLALADPNALERDLFRAELLEADIDQADFLRRRFHVASLVVKEAASGEPREARGERLAPAPERSRPAESGPATDGEELSLEDVLADVELWKERLEKVRRALDGLSGGQDEAHAGETLAERLAREVREKGWLSVEADHLIDEVPTFRLSSLVVEGFHVAGLPAHTFDLRGSELSTHPGLLDAPPQLKLASRDGAIAFEVDLAPASRAGGDGALRMTWKGLSVDGILSMLRLPGPPPLAGGTLDLELDGSWDQGRIGWVDLPLKVTFQDTTLTLDGLEPTSLDALELSIGISGRIDAPRIRFDPSTLTDALKDAGKRELANQLGSRLESELGELELPVELDGKVEETAGGVLKGLLGGRP